jgi:hypothetical protein
VRAALRELCGIPAAEPPAPTSVAVTAAAVATSLPAETPPPGATGLPSGGT